MNEQIGKLRESYLRDYAAAVHAGDAKTAMEIGSILQISKTDIDDDFNNVGRLQRQVESYQKDIAAAEAAMLEIPKARAVVEEMAAKVKTAERLWKQASGVESRLRNIYYRGKTAARELARIAACHAKTDASNK